MAVSKKRRVVPAMVCGLAALAVSGFPPSASAHHGWGSYDAENPLEISGEIVDISYDWPHAEMRLMSEGKTWEVVLAPPSRTRGRGLVEDVAVIGARAVVMGYVHRNRDVEIRVEWVRIGDNTYRMR